MNCERPIRLTLWSHGGGCGCKLGPSDLAELLRGLPAVTDPNVLIGPGTSDDAAVYRLSDTQALVSTVDFFTPIVDEPYDFGRIAAANALSDVYAMGGKPLYALNIVGFPKTGLPMEMLADILRGGADKVSEAGISVVGGHTVDDQEPKYGLSVTGIVHPDRIIANIGAKPGDRLYLTKPLGVGIIAAAIQREMADSKAIGEATELMARLNAGAGAAMSEVGVSAATDVTGFGLIGHLHEMTSGSKVRARVSLSGVPVLDAAWGLIRKGVAPGGAVRNRAHFGEMVRWVDKLDDEEQLVLCDPQTSGGMLIAVPRDRAEELEDALHRSKVHTIACIGEIVGDDEKGMIEVVR